MPRDVPSDGNLSSMDGSASCGVEPFTRLLVRHGLELRKGQTHTLQINVGLLCNQYCRHCHLEAGPNRTEVMNRQTIDEVLAYSGRAPFETVDITGGAPEMNPSLGHLIENIAPLTPRIMLRSNLTALADYQTDSLTDLCRKHRVVVVASLPSVNPSQTDSQRGKGVWEKSIHVLRKLNEIGYGHEGTGLELNLVSNPTGAFLPTRQCQAEKRFKNDLKRKWGLVFNNLFAFANVPLGRFRAWLEASGNLERYMQKLSTSFNPSTVQGLMCRTSVSVSWDGYLFDCDFNLARGAYLGARRRHISEMEGTPAPGSPIPAGDHCYACTAGSGFT